MIKFSAISNKNKDNYIRYLSALASLSGLFSDNVVQYLNYRVVENLFCKCFNALNISRSDTAFDAKYNNCGIGIKTFICSNHSKFEKIAEFNSVSKELKKYSGQELAEKLCYYRNERIEFFKRTYDINETEYHIVARKANKLLLFETEYDYIDINSLHNFKLSSKSIRFEDKDNSYLYNFSKSTLFRRFGIPKNCFELPINIIQDPFEVIIKLLPLNESISNRKEISLIPGIDYIILPLYSVKNKTKYIPERSGLNQWNALGRQRDPGEIYIPIPSEIRNLFPNFFPEWDKSFDLTVPTGEVLNSKVCQDNSKALMTNPNKALSNWLHRKILKLEEKELATMTKLDQLGFDSVFIQKFNDTTYSIDIMKTGSYDNFINHKAITSNFA